jgi:Protein of unknown function (DUF2800)
MQDQTGAALAAPALPHSPYGGSGAHRWTVCFGSINAQKGLPDDESPFAKEGTAGHAVGATCLESGQDAIEFAGRTVEGVEIDESVAEGLQVYLDTIRADQKERGGKLLIETKFHLSHLHPLFYGTADCVRIGTDGIMSVYDLKLGRGKIVEVTEHGGTRPNLQLAYYALGAMHARAAQMKSLKISRVELVVVQPRAWHKDGPVRRATFLASELELVATRLVEAARLCEAPGAPRVAGDHCTFCKAAPTCKTLRDFAFDAAQLDFERIGEKTVNPLTLTDAELAKTLDAIDVIETWISAVRAHAHILAGTANGLPGWKLVDKQARRKWEDEVKAASELCFAFGLDEGSIYDRKLLSPAQVEKLLSPTERKTDAFKVLCPARSSGSTLVRADNPRPERKPVDVDFIGETDEW